MSKYSTANTVAARIVQISASAMVGAFVFLVIEKGWFTSSERR